MTEKTWGKLPAVSVGNAGGLAFCEHQRQKSKRKECGGGSSCEHKRLERQCQECGGSALCEHKHQESV